MKIEIDVPGPNIVSEDNYLLSISSHDNSHTNNIVINSSDEVIITTAYILLSKEMNYVRSVNPDVDFQKIQDMLDSTDNEMFNLGISTLSPYVKYTCQFIKHIRNLNKYVLIQTILDYQKNNKTNITGKIR